MMLEAAFYLASAFWLGALHAATPGHGKTVAAAYLVGARGRVVDAITLGVVVTLAHTGGIVVFGILGTLSSSAMLPRQIEGYLALATGLLIVGLGLWMFWSQRWDLPWRSDASFTNPGVTLPRGAQIAPVAGGQSDAEPINSPDPHADHDHSHPPPHRAHDSATGDRHYPQGAAHHYRGHDHGESETPAVSSHGHSHGWGRHHHRHDVEAILAGRPSFGLLVGLGVAGGILPDPAALAVLLAAIANGTLVLGLLTVLVFSLGFASVLVVVGVVAARAGQIIFDRVDGRWTSWLSFATAVLVVVVGIVMTASAWRTLAVLG
jgi:nickel/cobalt transporter (NicO) family protein